MTINRKSLDERLEKHPSLKKRFEEILNITERKGTGPDTADAVEEQAIMELNKLGQEVLQEWAKNKTTEETLAYRKNHPQFQLHKKKPPTGVPHLGK